MSKRLALVAAIVLAVGGCADSPPESGYVRDRDHREAYTETWTQYVCTYQSKGVCYAQAPITHRDHHPERWRLYLEDCGSDAKCREGWRTVSRQEYDAHPIGTHYPNPM